MRAQRPVPENSNVFRHGFAPSPLALLYTPTSQDTDHGSYSVVTYPYRNRSGGHILVQPVEPYGTLDGEPLGGELGWAFVRDVGIRTA